MTLNKRYIRNIKSNISFYISVIIITALVVYMYVAISAAYSREKDFLDTNAKAVNREEGQFTLYKDMTDEEIADFEEKWDVDIERQYYVDAEISEDTGLRIFAPSKKVNKYIVNRGSDIESDNEILVSELFAGENDVDIGDEITLSLNGYRESFKVVGYEIRFDYLFCLRNINDTFSISSEFGVGIISDRAFEKFIRDADIENGNYYYSIVYNSDNEDEVRKEIYSKYTISSYVSADINNRIQTPNDQLDELGSMVGLILPVSILLVVLLMAVILGRKVKNERKMIGILNALGMTKFELARHYSIFGMIPGFIGGLMGMLLGNATAGTVIDLMIEGKLEPFNISVSSDMSTNIIAVALPTVCYTVAVFVMALVTIRGNSIELIKGSGKSATHRHFRLSKSKMSFRAKYRLRAVLGNPGRTLTLLGGLAIGGIILAFMLACVDSLEYYVKESVDSIGNFEYEYFLNELMIEPNDEELLEENSAGFLAASLAAEGKNDIVTVMGIDDTNYINLKTDDGGTLTIEDGRYYISSMGSMIYDVDKGDKLVLKDINSLEEYEITVDGVFENGSQNMLVTSNKTLAELMKLDTMLSINVNDVKIYNGIMSDREISLDESLILKKIVHEDIKKQLDENILKSMKSMLWFVLILGAGVMVMIIFLMVNVLLTESIVNISMLKVLGYNDSEINSIITHIYHGIVAIGSVLGLLLGIWVNEFNFKQSTSVYNCYVKNVITPSSIMIYLAIAIGSYALSLFLLGSKVKKVSMVESLKDTRA